MYTQFCVLHPCETSCSQWMFWVCKGCIKILSVIPFCLGLLLLFCLHSVKYTTEHIPGIDHKQSDAKGFTINLWHSKYPWNWYSTICSGIITDYNCMRLLVLIQQIDLLRAILKRQGNTKRNCESLVLPRVLAVSQITRSVFQDSRIQNRACTGTFLLQTAQRARQHLGMGFVTMAIREVCS